LLALLLGCQLPSPVCALAQNAPLPGDGPSDQSHQAVASSLIAQCVLDASPGVNTFAVSRPIDLVSADPAVIGALRSTGRAISIAPWSTDETAGPILRYQLEAATVSHEKSTRRRFRRTVSVRLAYTFVSGDRTVLDADICERSYEDDISRKMAAEWAASSTGIPLTLSPLPRDGVFKRLIRPAVAVAATSVSLYLLFSLRSERQNDSQ
jgi:hypothetical protein